MKKIWNDWLKNILLLYCGLYTLATITNSIIYLAGGTFEDPSGNWHELDRAVVVLIVVAACALIKNLHVKNFWLKTLIVYVPTMLLTFLYVFMRGLTVELASTAYRDIFINYTVGFAAVSLIAFAVMRIRNKK
ncbi:MAG: hypothetical protein K2N60_07855 [Oscillospiraceae bacterium]|nr:hypothetical protein [Oscillospiraceae bacterium]